MTIDFTRHSIWLSKDRITAVITGYDKDNNPIYSSNKYIMPSETSYFYLGGNTSLSYSNNYNATVMGKYNKDKSDPGDAYFTDSASGSVSKISLSCTRVQPTNAQTNYTDVTGDLPNSQVIQMLRDMKCDTQALKGAYVLRIYNSVQKPNTLGKAYNIPIYIESLSYSIDLDNPNVVDISLSFIKRNPMPNINVGTTVDN